MEQTGTGDTAITQVNQMGAEIIRLRQREAELTKLLADTQTVLEMAQGRVAILEACIKSNYDASMPNIDVVSGSA
jgi:hypothetical protein